MRFLISVPVRREIQSRYRQMLRFGICFVTLLPGLRLASVSPACDNIADPITVVECALAKSPALRSEQQEVQVLSGQRVRAQSLLPTHPTVQVSFAGRRPPSAGASGEGRTTFNWYVTLSQEVEIAGQRGARVRAADSAIAAQQRRVFVTAQEVASAALGTYYDAYPDVVFVGVVETVGKQLDASARTVVTRIAITNKSDLLKVGLFGKARVSLDDAREQTRGLVVPLSAVTRIADRDVVFVRQADEHFEVHPVTLGPSASGEVQVLSGLREGEQVVVDGVFALKGAILKSTFAEEE